MRLGYPCINTSVGCSANSTFRLANYSESRLVSSVRKNLECLESILRYNVNKGLLFFRIGSGIVPFASHPICTFNWEDFFRTYFLKLGSFISDNEMRISMHPDQFVLLNSPDEDITNRSIAELEYHQKVLDAMELDESAKIQIHVGGAYGDKKLAIRRFIERYRLLPRSLKKRLVIENDDRLYSLKDCLNISYNCGVPVLFDSYHHECLNNDETVAEALKAAACTWKTKDGVPMVDYSSQQRGARIGTHSSTIDIKHFRKFLNGTKDLGFDFDVMLEIKDKEKSAVKALRAARRAGRL